MSRGLGKVEKKIIEYLSMANNDCTGSIDDCPAADGYYCPYSKAKKSYISTGELCLYVAGIYKCPASIEDYRLQRNYNASIYKSVTRATKSLEKKGYIESQKHVERFSQDNLTWYMSYTLI